MARTRKFSKAKEPIKIWLKPLRNGNKAVYLRSYVANSGSSGYQYENLGMYLVPEVDSVARNQNKNTLMVAEAIKAQRIIDNANGKAGIRKSDRSKKTLLVDWMKHYSEEKKKLGQSRSHAMSIHNVMLHLIRYRGDKVTMKQVDKAFCEGFLMYLANANTIGTDNPQKRGDNHEKPMLKSTAKLYFGVFVSSLNEAVRKGIIESNPAYRLSKEEKKPIKPNGGNRGFLEINEVKAMMNASCANEQVKMAFMFACFCGLRLSDIRDLRWEDIKKTEKGFAISKVQIKTRESIMVPLSENALRWMPVQGTAKGMELVFDLPGDSAISRCVKKLAKNAGIEKNLTFHMSRHTFATTLLTLGADLYTTSKLLGHKSIRTTQIYAEVVNKKRIEAVSLLDEEFK